MAAGLEHKNHRKRVKERFLKEGLDHFAHHNILELILFYAIPQGDTNPLAHRLMRTFGSFSGVLNASFEDLCRVDGIGEHSAILLKLCGALVRPYLEDSNNSGVVLSSSEQLCRFLLPKFAGRTVETAYLVCLDAKYKLLYCGILSEGTIDNVPIFVRSIVGKAIAVNASLVVLAHNHPTGFALPSQDDIHATHAVAKALEPLSIRLLDHIIVAMGDAVSLSDSGLL